MSEEQAMKTSTTERKALSVDGEVGVVMEALLAREFFVTGVGKAATERVRARGVVRCCPYQIREAKKHAIETSPAKSVNSHYDIDPQRAPVASEILRDSSAAQVVKASPANSTKGASALDAAILVGSLQCHNRVSLSRDL